MENSECGVPGCANQRKTKGYCSGHYNQWKRGLIPSPISGDARVGHWGKGPKSLDDYFWARVEKAQSCWIWIGIRTTLGYPQIKFQGVRLSGHRYSWAISNGPIPAGEYIDHLCHNPSCVNPDHLRSVPPKGNSENRKGAASSSKSGIRGVYYDPPRGKWRAVVRHNGRTVQVGRFDSAADAELAVQAKRAALFSVSN